MHISITGDLGSGKSTVGKLLGSHLGYEFISTGQIQRELGKKHGMNTLEFNKYTDANIDIDHYIDNHLREINNAIRQYILDSRLAWFFVPSSFKVYLLCFEDIAAERIMNDNTRTGEPDAKSVIEKIQDSYSRRKIEKARFEKNYGAILKLTKSFDLILDVSFISLEQVFNIILSSYNKWKNEKYYNRCLLSPKRIFPLEHVRLVASSVAKEIKNNIKENGYDYSFPVNLLEDSDFFYMYDGHKRLSASLYCSLPIIPCEPITSGPEEIIKGLSAERYINDAFNISQCYDWEDAHSFRYLKYPEK